MAPVRVIDSRQPPEQVGPWATPWDAGVTRDVTVAGQHGVPANATAVVLNVTVTGTTAESFLSVWPAAEPRPTASSVNWAAGQTIPNAVTVKLGGGGKVSVFNNAGTVNVILDVVGYYTAGAGAQFFPLDPTRVLDSRPAPETVGVYATPWLPQSTRPVAVHLRGGVPDTATAVLANVTVTRTSAESFLSVWPAGDLQPIASSLNWTSGMTIANAVTARIGDGGSLAVYNNSGVVDVIVDEAGYYG